MNTTTIEISHDEFNLYIFSRKYPGWHTYATDCTTLRVVTSMVRLGMIELNQFNQFRALPPN